jgi:hypothetical protein
MNFIKSIVVRDLSRIYCKRDSGLIRHDKFPFIRFYCEVCGPNKIYSIVIILSIALEGFNLHTMGTGALSRR